MKNLENYNILYLSNIDTKDSNIISELNRLGHSVHDIYLNSANISEIDVDAFNLIMIENPTYEDLQQIVSSNSLKYKNIPIIVVVDYGSESFIAESIRLGVDEFLTKQKDNTHIKLIELILFKAVYSRKTKTSKFRAEKAVLESEKQFETLVQNLKDGICIFDCDENFIYANEAAEKIFGVEPGKLVTRNLLEFVDDINATTIKNQSKLRMKGEIGRYEISINAEDGIQKNVALTVSPKFDDTNDSYTVLGVFQNVTERNENFERLFFQSTLLDQIQDQVLATDMNGTITYVNNAVCDSLGMSSSELIGANVSILGENPEKGATQADIVETTLNKGSWRGEVINIASNGNEIHLDCRTQILKDNNGNPYAMIGVSTDITEAKVIEKALIESEEKYRLLAENQKDVVFTITKEGFLEYISPSVRQFGYDADEETGIHFSKYLTTEFEVEFAAQVLEEIFISQQPKTIELNYLAKNGDLIPVEITATPNVEDGNHAYLNCIMRDISQRKKAEKALKQSEERLVKAQEVAEIGSWEYVIKSKTTNWSKQMYTLFGLNPNENEPSYEELPKYIHPDDWEFFINAAKNSISTQEGFDIEIRIIQSSGNTIWVNSKCEPKYTNNEFVGLIGTTQNISYRKQAEDNLKQVIVEAKALYDASRAIFDCKTFGESARKIFNACRATTGAISGYIALLNESGTENEVVFLEDGGLPCIVDPKLPMPIRGLREQAYMHKKVVFDNNFMKSEWLKYLPEGHVVMNNVLFAPLIINDSVVGVMGLANKPSNFSNNDLRMAKAFGDLAAIALERSKTFELLRARDERYSSFFNATEDIVFIKDSKFRYVLVNQATIDFFGLKEDEILGKTDFDLMPEEPARICKQSDELALKENRVIITTETFNDRIFETRKFQIKLDNQIGIGAFIHDKTDEKQKESEIANLEEQFRQAQKMEAIGILAGGVAHDFNNILNVIIGYSELLLDSTPELDPSYEKIVNIKKNADRATVLTRQLLAFSRKQILQPTVMNLNTVIVNMKNMLWRLIGEDIELVTSLDPLLSPIKADKGQIEQVIMNIVVNARDAMPDGGKVIIETKNMKLDNDYVKNHTDGSVDHHVMLTITDTGSGMSKETREKCFEPFFTTKKLGKGTGLGISTAYGIVKQSGGSIWVDSEIGKGTSFVIYFPANFGPASERNVRITDPLIRRKNVTVLVVEDNEPMCEMIGEILTNADVRVFRTTQPSEAIEIYKAHKDEIDILLTDVVMPGLSGKKLVDQLQTIDREIKVIFMSGYTDDAIVHKGILDEETEFIQKPFTGKELVKKIHSVFEAEV